MLWKGRRESDNVEDRRGMSGGQMVAGGGVIGVIILLVNMFLGGDSGDLSQVINQQQQAGPQTEEQKAAEAERASFVKVVLADTEDVWGKIFSDQGKDYPRPKLVMFSGSTESGCGFASAATGPFYCPSDHQVYIDLAFAEEMKNRFGASGDFALAYVIAHEVGHHIQTLTGASQKVQKVREQGDEREANRYSVMLELQADFYAGLWAHYDQKMKDVIKPSDIEEALNAANAIGDDRLQQQSQGRVVPDAFTHGTSAQRMYWFKKGFDTGDINQGNTFNDPSLN